ncbi:Mitochondrial ribosome small subunit biogenesis protein [Coniothyrium glycines]
MRPALRQARTLLNHEATTPAVLCPTLLKPLVITHSRHAPRQATARFSNCRPWQHETSVAAIPSTVPFQPRALSKPTTERSTGRRSLPRACPGCGAPTQIYDKKEAGYYDVDRKVVRGYLHWDPDAIHEKSREDDIYAKALQHVSPEVLGEMRVNTEDNEASTNDQSPETPVCDRCHNLIHHRVGTPIHHPTVESIQQTIAESPHRRNHIYHVVDAADFPLSIVPNLQSSLRIPKLRTQNRRARHKGWVANDRIAEVSFIITRADLLAPKKEQVDALMPYVREVLRDALGRQNQNARLGNVRLVSAKRGWWTKQVKEDIWERGGAGWMVGKVNVGKSNLFEEVFPKGRGADYQNVRKIRTAAEREAMMNSAETIEELSRIQKQLAKEDAEDERLHNRPHEHLHKPPEEELDEEDDFEDPDALLPPPQPYTLYPVLPVASSLPGTTASPIRIPFGRNRGELVDLPGLARTKPGLETFVKPEEHDNLVMKQRINSERYTLKPGQSLLLGGGLIRITPRTEDLVFLVYPFVPLHPHITRTDKAIDYQAQTSERNLDSILAPDVGPRMTSAGTFPLKWDVTKTLAGPVTAAAAGKMKPENLPFRIWSTDILLEGVGWIEVSAQTRRPQGWKPLGMAKKDPNHAQHARQAETAALQARKQRKFDAIARAEAEHRDVDDALRDEFFDEDNGDVLADWQETYPEVEVFSPLGKFIGQRRPMCASVVSGPKYVASRDRKERPRRSMVSVKRQRKPAARK